MRTAGLALTFGLAACAQDNSAGAPAALWNTNWTAKSVAGRPVVH